MKFKFIPYGREDEAVLFPAKYEVCGRCQGKGVHDCWEGGMSQDEMAEQGPEFFEDYMSGMYDKRCDECKGERVVLVIDRRRANKEALAEYDQYQQDEQDYRALVEAERRMGC
jgi:hypothetical protein